MAAQKLSPLFGRAITFQIQLDEMLPRRITST